MLLLYLTNGVQDLLTVLLQKCAPLESFLHASRPDKIHEPRRMRDENFPDIGWSVQPAIQVSVAALGEEICAEIPRVERTQQRRQGQFGEKNIPEKSPFFGPKWDATGSGVPSLLGVRQYRQRWHTKVPRSF